MPSKNTKSMQYRENRWETFENGTFQQKSKQKRYWTHEVPSIDQLVDCGFYFTPTKINSDQVTCISCKKKETNVGGVENIAEYHLTHNPLCALSQVIAAQIDNLSSRLDSYWELYLLELFKDPLSKGSVSLRKKTFGSFWKLDKEKNHIRATSMALAKAGFYFCPLREGNDRVQCVYCNCSLDTWEGQDDPIEEHRLNATGNCYFLSQYDCHNKGKKYVSRGRSASRSKSTSKIFSEKPNVKDGSVGPLLDQIRDMKEDSPYHKDPLIGQGEPSLRESTLTQIMGEEGAFIEENGLVTVKHSFVSDNEVNSEKGPLCSSAGTEEDEEKSQIFEIENQTLDNEESKTLDIKADKEEEDDKQSNYIITKRLSNDSFGIEGDVKSGDIESTSSRGNRNSLNPRKRRKGSRDLCSSIWDEIPGEGEKEDYDIKRRHSRRLRSSNYRAGYYSTSASVSVRSAESDTTANSSDSTFQNEESFQEETSTAKNPLQDFTSKHVKSEDTRAVDSENLSLTDEKFRRILVSPLKSKKIKLGEREGRPMPLYDISNQNIGDYEEGNLEFIEKNLRPIKRENTSLLITEKSKAFGTPISEANFTGVKTNAKASEGDKTSKRKKSRKPKPTSNILDMLTDESLGDVFSNPIGKLRQQRHSILEMDQILNKSNSLIVKKSLNRTKVMSSDSPPLDANNEEIVSNQKEVLENKEKGLTDMMNVESSACLKPSKIERIEKTSLGIWSDPRTQEVSCHDKKKVSSEELVDSKQQENNDRLSNVSYSESKSISPFEAQEAQEAPRHTLSSTGNNNLNEQNHSNIENNLENSKQSAREEDHSQAFHETSLNNDYDTMDNKMNKEAITKPHQPPSSLTTLVHLKEEEVFDDSSSEIAKKNHITEIDSKSETVPETQVLLPNEESGDESETNSNKGRDDLENKRILASDLDSGNEKHHNNVTEPQDPEDQHLVLVNAATNAVEERNHHLNGAKPGNTEEKYDDSERKLNQQQQQEGIEENISEAFNSFIESSTPEKRNMKNSIEVVAEPLSSIEFWPSATLKSTLDSLQNMENASEYLLKTVSSKFNLNNDYDGELTNFIANMPEEEENMTIKQWILHNAANCNTLIRQNFEEIIKEYESEFTRAIEFIEHLPTID